MTKIEELLNAMAAKLAAYFESDETTVEGFLPFCEYGPNLAIFMPLITVLGITIAVIRDPWGNCDICLQLPGYTAWSLFDGLLVDQLPTNLLAAMEEAAKKMIPCPDCGGTGEIPEGCPVHDNLFGEICQTCCGFGWIPRPKYTIEANQPPADEQLGPQPEPEA